MKKNDSQDTPQKQPNETQSSNKRTTPSEDISSMLFSDNTELLKNLTSGLSNANIGLDIISEDYTILYQNQYLLDKFGDLTGKPCYKAYMGIDEPCTFCPMKDAIKNNKVEEAEVLGADGRYYRIISAPVTESGIQTGNGIEVILDITESKQLEKTLQNNDDFLNSIIDNAPIAMWISDNKGNVIRINQALRDNLEVTDENVVGKYNVFYDIQVQEQGFLDLVRSAYEEGEYVEFTINYNTEKEEQLGIEHPVKRILEITLTPVLDYRGKVANVICMQRDITEQEMLRNSLVDTNRALLVLSESNQALVHSTDENELMESVCRILIEKGGYLFAWVGYAKYDEEKSIIPIAKCGNDNGYIDEIKATWADTEYGQGPTGTAIRTGEVSLINDILSDPRFKPWRERAEKNKFLSSVALPIKEGERAFGVITIYSDKVNAFSDDEIFLLTEMAEDLSFGILALRMRKEKDQNDQRLKDAQALGKIGNWEYDRITNEMIWHEGMFEIYGRDPSLGAPQSDENERYYSPEQLEAFEQVTDQLVRQKEEISYDMEFTDEKGEKKALAGNIRPILNQQGEVIRIFGIIQDITEQKRAEEELLLRAQLLDNASDGIALLTIDKREFIYVNNAYCNILGYSRNDLIGKNVHQFELSSIENQIQSMEYRIRQEGSIVFEVTHIRKDGTEIIVEVHSVIIEVGGKEYFLSAERDLTEKKSLERSLRESEENFKISIDNSPICINIYSKEGDLVYINKSGLELRGFDSIEEFKNTPAENRMTQESYEKRIQWDNDRKSGKALPSTYTFDIIRPDGEVRNLQCFRSTVFWDRSEHEQVIAVDITQRKKAEQLLAESEERYRTLFETMAQGVVYQNINGEIILANPAAEKILGLTIDQMKGRTSIDPRWRAIHEDGTVFPGEEHPSMVALRTGKEVRNIIMGVFHRRDEKYHWMVVNAIPLFESKEVTPNQVYTTFIDITEQYEAEMMLREVSLHQETILAAVPDIIMEVDNDKVYRWANQAGIDFFGDDVIGKEAAEYFLGDQDTYSVVQPIFSGDDQETVYVESYQRRKDGEKRLLAWWCRTLKDAQGNTTGALSAATDITERYEAEELLRESELFNSSLLNNAPNPINVINPDTTIRYVNPALEKITGYSFEELIGQKAPYNFWGDDTGESYINRLKTSMKEGLKGIERQFTKKNGDKFWVQITNMPVHKDGELDYLLASWIDITESKAATEALRESEERYRNLVTSSPIGVYISQDGNFLFVNPEFEKLTGYSETELSTRKWDSIVHPEDRTKVRGNAIDMLKGDSTQSYEFRILASDGTIRWVIENVTSITYKGKKASLGTLMDITERKQNEEVLRFSDTTLRSINEAVIALDNDNRISFWNKKSEELFGTKASEAIGKHIADLITIAEEYPGQQVQRLKNLQENKSNREEQLYHTQNGDIWVDAHAQAIEDSDGHYGWVILATDITERRKAEEELRQSEEKLSTTIESLPQGLIVTDNLGMVLQANRSAFQLYGCETNEDIIGKNGMDFIDENERQLVLDEIIQARNEDRQATVHYTAVRKNGTRFSAEMSVAQINNASGESMGMVSVFEDITERQKMQENLMVTDRLASVGELAAGIAHELNNPLTSVIGFSDMILERNDIPEDLIEDLSIINKESIRASQVARHLLTFARRHPDDKRQIDINEIITLVLELREYEQRVNNIEVVTNLDRNLPKVTANDFQLQQVFINIIINAEHFMIETNGEGCLEIETRQENGSVIVSFTDDGPGIPSESINHIFDPFFTTKEVGKGTGLGLSICYGIIAEHGGTIRAENAPGKGARFVIELPVYDQE